MVGTLTNDHHSGDNGTERTGGSAYEHPSTESALPAAHALLEMKAESESLGSTCAILTPAIKAKLKELGSGQVLEIRVNDSSAREDITAWCHLSGNELLAMTDEGHQGVRFFLRKK